MRSRQGLGILAATALTVAAGAALAWPPVAGHSAGYAAVDKVFRLVTAARGQARPANPLPGHAPFASAVIKTAPY